jgi:hypothetical protein
VAWLEIAFILGDLLGDADERIRRATPAQEARRTTLRFPYGRETC